MFCFFGFKYLPPGCIFHTEASLSGHTHIKFPALLLVNIPRFVFQTVSQLEKASQCIKNTQREGKAVAQDLLRVWVRRERDSDTSSSVIALFDLTSI